MEKKRLVSQHFDDEGGDDEELLKLSLSTSTSTSTSLPSSPPFPSNPNPKKRSFSQSFDGEEDNQEPHNLSLSTAPPGPSSSSLQPLPSAPHGERSLINSTSTSPNSNPNPVRQGVSAGSARYYHRTLKSGKSETIEAPYTWATTRRATVHSLDHLLSRGINIISGVVKCEGCQETYKIEYKLEEWFKKIKDFISANKLAMNQRAPDAWMNPRLDSCRSCWQTLKPVIDKKRKINWLFLLLGEMLGCCRVDHLKYFCKHSMIHMTGKKDRLLYLTYLGLCKQLDPHGPFDD